MTAGATMRRGRTFLVGLLAALALTSATAVSSGQTTDASPLSEEAAGLRERIDRLRDAESWLGLPETSNAREGPRTVAAGERVAGAVTVLRGNLDVYGVIDGDAVAYGGDVVIHPGGAVTGDAIAVLGRVRLEGGAVSGEVRALRGSLEPAPVAAAGEVASVREQLELVGGWLMILVLMGIGVLLFASGPLDGVTDTLQRGFGRALLVGIAGQLALLPVLILGIVALAATIVGILLIPFAVVAYALAAVGLMMLGFLAVARMTGGALTRRAGPGRTERGALLRALVFGILAFMAAWAIAALLAPLPLAATVARTIAFALSWVAVSAGFGAAILSRAGTRRPADDTSTLPPEPEEELSWQTPTPIGGVLAARRPTSSVPR